MPMFGILSLVSDDSIFMPALDELLAQLGLDRLEVDGYSELLQRGTMAAAIIAKRLGIPRTTAYTMGRI